LEDIHLSSLLSINPNHYDIPECDYIIRTDTTKKYDFEYLGIRIHTLLKHVVCLACSQIVHCFNLSTHLAGHCYDNVNPNIGKDLAALYGLETREKTITGPTFVIPPIVGIPLHSRPLFFCATCHHGFSTTESLRSHSSLLSHGRNPVARMYTSYAQKISGFGITFYIPVDIDSIYPDPDLPEKQVQDIMRSVIMERNYSTMALVIPKDHLTLSSFFRSDNWNEVVEGHSPAEIIEARRLNTDNDEAYAGRLRVVCDAYMERLQERIASNLQFGLGSVLGSVHECVSRPLV